MVHDRSAVNHLTDPSWMKFVYLAAAFTQALQVAEQSLAGIAIAYQFIIVAAAEKATREE